MNRKQFIKRVVPLAAASPLIFNTMNLNALHKMTSVKPNSSRMPVLFLGHGSPMNAIEENEFVTGFRKIGEKIEKPKAILCVSAHWETRGTYVTAMENPRTIHDFGGFPKKLYEVQYPAPGSPELADEVKNTIQKTEVGLDQKWGLDHGAWSVIKHLYPDADVPVIQMSLDYSKGPQYHFDLARELAVLRNRGVLIVGSGNMVHNLGLVAWRRLNEEFAFDWAQEASDKMRSYIVNQDFDKLINYTSQGKSFELAIPTPEHYYPLLYALALKEKGDEIDIFNDKPVAGSLTMTSVLIGKA
jgi:4,5-DOPA dioxygenase extradiol